MKISQYILEDNSQGEITQTFDLKNSSHIVMSTLKNLIGKIHHWSEIEEEHIWNKQTEVNFIAKIFT